MLDDWAEGNARAAVWLTKMQGEHGHVPRPRKVEHGMLRPLKGSISSEIIFLVNARRLVLSFCYGQLDVDCAHAGLSQHGSI